MSIELKGISFSYGDIRALNDVTLNIDNGAVGLLGPNGAGKSTLIRVLLGFLAPDKGEGTVMGYDIRRNQSQIRRLVGYMPEDDCFIPGMDAVSFVAFFGELSGMPRQESIKRAHDVLFYVGLGEERYRLVDTYSAGMRQRLKLAQSIVHDPKILFLDEPTSNLDPRGRIDILDLIREIKASNEIQMLISSHILADIETVCESVVIMNKGRIAAQGQIEELRTFDYSLYEIRIKGDAEAFRLRLESQGCRVQVMDDRQIKVYMQSGMDRMLIFKAAVETGTQVRLFTQSRTSLEDIFAQHVGVD